MKWITYLLACVSIFFCTTANAVIAEADATIPSVDPATPTVLTVNFPGMSSVHTEVRITDNIPGSADGTRVAAANWKTDQAVLTVLPQVYDLRIRKGSATYIVDNVDCSSGSCTVDNIVATLTVNFPGMSSVHTEARVPDSVSGVAEGGSVTYANWKKDQAVLKVFPQTYDLRIRKGKATHIVDNVDCSSGSCTVGNFVATLTVNFPGMSSVHTEARVPDNVSGVAEGGSVTYANWKRDLAVLKVFPQVYDLRIRKGSATHIVDNVDCSSGSCTVGNFVATLTVNFPGMSSVHTEARVPDNVTGVAEGGSVTYANWKNDQAILKVFPQAYDLRIRKGSATHIVDKVDCSSGSCTVGNIVATMTVNFPGMSGVHTEARVTDGATGIAEGGRVTYANWKRDLAVLKVFPQVYDLRIRKGSATHIVDKVDCSRGSCTVDNIVATLTVNFPGMSSVHTEARVPDGAVGVAEGGSVTYANWKRDQAVLKVFPQTYDLRIRKGKATHIVDKVDCSSGSCTVDNFVATLTVNFPGMSSVHTEARVSDGATGVAGGGSVTYANWKNDQAVLKVFPQTYDLRIRKGHATHIVDNVDCSGGSCTVDNIVATMTVNFPGMSGVHTEARVTDNVSERAEGGKIAALNWKTDQAVLAVFPQVYDLRLRKGHATHIVDNVDCSSGSCTVDNIVATMTVNFPGMNSVHTEARVTDGETGTAEGGSVTYANWKRDLAVLKVFPQVYDLRIRKGAGVHIVDSVDCSSRSCTVDNIVATMTVNFPGLNSVHTDARVPDDDAGVAGGGTVTAVNWKNNQAVLTVFPQVYDVRIRKGAGSHIVDGVDCSSGSCTVEKVVATLTAEFPGLSRVHTDVRVPDGVKDVAGGGLITRKNYQTHKAELVVLRGHVDVLINHGATSVFDDVDCSGEACHVLVEGNSQVTLINGDRNVAIANQYLKAFEKLPDGTLVYVTSGITSINGTVHFTFEGLGEGRIYVIETYNPFGNRKKYYSPFITKAGALKFIVTADGENELDLTPPKIAISSPLDGSNVSNKGFEVQGTASDNTEVETVILSVVSGGSATLIPAAYSAANNAWTAIIPASAATSGPLVITAVATDLAKNRSSASVTVTPITDTQGPQLAFTSHSDGDDVRVTGFLLSGTVTDLTGVQSLTATVNDPVLGLTINNAPVAFSIGSGNWTLAVQNGQVTENQAITVSLVATDVDGNTSSASINLNVVAVDNSGIHMINRISFGATPDLLLEVDTLGAQNYLGQQLAANNIDDSTFDSMIAGVTPTTTAELQAWTLLHMTYSKRQLLEVMTWFWDNHFNTDLDTTRTNALGVEVSDTVAYELAENQAFRANALGNFRDLLGISAKSPAMLIYLDSISNVAGDSNENYARELLELHTMGVDGGYTHHEIEAGAEIFTGWHLQNDAFFFDAAMHNPAAHTVLGTAIPAGGVEQGEQMLDVLAAHSSTARHICRKLVSLFVNDVPPTSLVQRCGTRFQETVNDPDQIVQVLNLILTSPEFFDVANYRGKIKTPVEFVVGAVRNLQAQTDGSDLSRAISRMGIDLYLNPIPTGWSEIGDDWINSSLLIERIKWVNQMTRAKAPSATYTEPLVLYPARGFETAEGIVGYLLNLSVGDDYTDLSRQQALDLLNSGGGFDLSDVDADNRLRQLNGAVLSYPQYQYQ